MVINKPLVQQQFNIGLKTYNNNAHVQYMITDELISVLTNLGFKNFDKIFEVGCGSGFLTEKIVKNLSYNKLIANDISCTAEDQIRVLAKSLDTEIDFLCGDAEEIEFPENNEAILSSSTIQWFSKPELFFKKVNKALSSEGLFAFSTFGEENFIEVKSTTGIGLEYHSLDQLKEILVDDFDILFQKEWKETMFFDNPLDVLKHIKQTGVNGIQKTYFGKKQLQEFIQTYNQNHQTKDQKVSLTYNPIIIIAQKR